MDDLHLRHRLALWPPAGHCTGTSTSDPNSCVRCGFCSLRLQNPHLTPNTCELSLVVRNRHRLRHRHLGRGVEHRPQHRGHTDGDRTVEWQQLECRHQPQPQCERKRPERGRGGSCLRPGLGCGRILQQHQFLPANTHQVQSLDGDLEAVSLEQSLTAYPGSEASFPRAEVSRASRASPGIRALCADPASCTG